MLIKIHLSHQGSPQKYSSVQFSSVQSLNCVWLFGTLWTTAHQASLSITNSQSLLKLMFIKSVMPSTTSSSGISLYCLQSFQPLRCFESQFFESGGQSIGTSASALVLPMNIHNWFPLGWTDWRRQWQPTPVFLPGESQGRRSLVGCRLWGHTESDTTEVT